MIESITFSRDQTFQLFNLLPKLFLIKACEIDLISNLLGLNSLWRELSPLSCCIIFSTLTFGKLGEAEWFFVEQILEEIVACNIFFELTLLFYLLSDMIVRLLHTSKFQIGFYKLLSLFLGIFTHFVDDSFLVHNVNLSCCPLSLVLAWILRAAI